MGLTVINDGFWKPLSAASVSEGDSSTPKNVSPSPSAHVLDKYSLFGAAPHLLAQ